MTTTTTNPTDLTYPLLHFFPLPCGKILPKRLSLLPTCLSSFSLQPAPIWLLPPTPISLTLLSAKVTRTFMSLYCSILSLQYRWSFPSPGYSFFTWFPGHQPLLVFFPYFACSLTSCLWHVEMSQNSVLGPSLFSIHTSSKTTSRLIYWNAILMLRTLKCRNLHL